MNETKHAEQVQEMRQRLEAGLNRQLGSQWGCWVLFVVVAGVVIGAALLLRSC